MTLYTYEEAALILTVSYSWLTKNIKRLPHTKFHEKGVRFTPAQIQEIVEMFARQPPELGFSPSASLMDLRPSQARRRAR